MGYTFNTAMHSILLCILYDDYYCMNWQLVINVILTFLLILYTYVAIHVCLFEDLKDYSFPFIDSFKERYLQI